MGKRFAAMLLVSLLAISACVRTSALENRASAPAKPPASAQNDGGVYVDPALAYPGQGFSQEAFDRATEGVRVDIIQESDYMLSSSTQSTRGSIEAGSKKLYVDSLADFKIGQGIAIASLERMSNTIDENGKKVKENYTWMVDVVSDMRIVNGQAVITLKHREAPRSVHDVVVKHDNYYAFKAINSYYAKASVKNVAFKLPKGEYWINAIRVAGTSQSDYDPDAANILGNSIEMNIFAFNDKSSVYIDFSGSSIYMNDEFYMGYVSDRQLSSSVWLKESNTSTLMFLLISNSTNITVKNLALNGGIKTSTRHTNLSANQINGITLQGVANGLIEDCDISYMSTDGITLSTYNNPIPIHDITLRRVKCSNNGRNNMSSGSMYNLLIDSSEFSYGGVCGSFKPYNSGGIDFECTSDGVYFEDIVITNTRMYKNLGYNFDYYEAKQYHPTRLINDAGRKYVIFDNCLIYNDYGAPGEIVASSRDFSATNTLNEVIVKNSLITVDSTSKAGARPTVYTRETFKPVTFINNTFLGGAIVENWGSDLLFSGNSFFLEYKSYFMNSHWNLTAQKPTDASMRFDGDFIYFSEFAYMETYAKYLSAFPTSTGSSYVTGGYNFKDVTIYNEYGSFTLPGTAARLGTKFGIAKSESSDTTSSYDNVTVFGSTNSSKLDTGAFQSFHGVEGRSFSTVFTPGATYSASKLKVMTYEETDKEQKEEAENRYRDEKEKAIKLLASREGITYSEWIGSTGSALNPHPIRTVDEFMAIGSKPNVNYRLENDLDFTGINYTPRGTLYNYPYSIMLDGNGYKIINLTVNTSGEVGGLFGILKNSEIRNLTLENPNIVSKNYAGALVGCMRGGIIENCHVSGGSVRGESRVGGLVGMTEAEGLIIKDCTTDTSVSASGSVGGLIGKGQASIDGCLVKGATTATKDGVAGGLIGWYTSSGQSITGSRVLGSVKGNAYVGGLVGYDQSVGTSISECSTEGALDNSSHSTGGLIGSLLGSGLDISNCYSTAQIKGTEYVGGLIGAIRSSKPVSISNSYFAGTIKGTHSGTTNGITGGNAVATNAVTVSGCYFDSQKTGLSKPAANALTTAKMKSIKSFPGWDFDTVWSISEGVSYPQLRRFILIPV